MNRGFSIQAPPFFIEDYILERPFAMNKQETHLAAETLSQSVSEQPKYFYDPYGRNVQPIEVAKRHLHHLTEPGPNEAIHNAAYDNLCAKMSQDRQSTFVDECIGELQARHGHQRVGFTPMSETWATISAHDHWVINILMQQLDAPRKKRPFINAYRKRTNSRKARK